MAKDEGKTGEIRRIKSYIEGFDEAIQGGIPEGHIVLVTGTPGTLKTSVVYNILYHNAKHDSIKGIHVTLEQSRDSIIQHMNGLGMPLESVKHNLNVLDLRHVIDTLEGLRGDAWINTFKGYLRRHKDVFDYKLLVIDSLPIFELLAELDNPRIQLFHFLKWLRTLDVTVFLIDEMAKDSSTFGRYGEDFIVDGIIHLLMEKVGVGRVKRAIRCIKMRSTNHSTDYFVLFFEDGVFKVAESIEAEI
jgi:KaiC/GvpD/RAD55 family RecA-like ATPase